MAADVKSPNAPGDAEIAGEETSSEGGGSRQLGGRSLKGRQLVGVVSCACARDQQDFARMRRGLRKKLPSAECIWQKWRQGFD